MLNAFLAKYWNKAPLYNFYDLILIYIPLYNLYKCLINIIEDMKKRDFAIFAKQPQDAAGFSDVSSPCYYRSLVHMTQHCCDVCIDLLIKQRIIRLNYEET